MQEKQMVNDALNSINSGLTSYASMIAQTENTELRSTLKQMRDQAEKSQYDLYNIAKSLNYYTPAQQASEQEIMKVKSEVCGSSQSSSGSSSMGSSNSMGSSSSTSGSNSMSSSNSMGSSNSMSGSSSMGSSNSMGSSGSMGSYTSMSSSSGSQGIADDLDEQKRRALQAPPKSDMNSFR